MTITSRNTISFYVSILIKKSFLSNTVFSTKYILSKFFLTGLNMVSVGVPDIKLPHLKRLVIFHFIF